MFKMINFNTELQHKKKENKTLAFTFIPVAGTLMNL